jgi:small nuclear ribonucleoprotein D3
MTHETIRARWCLLDTETEDNMNVHMQNITLTGRDGKVSKLEYVYIRGSKMRFMILPDMLKVWH